MCRQDEQSSSPKAKAKAMKFTKTEIQKMRMEIIAMFDGELKSQTQFYPAHCAFRDNLFVKHAPAFYTKDEWRNQRHVWKLVDPSIVRVPETVDHFEWTYPGHRHPTGFIVMECAATGEQQLEENLSDAQIDQIATIIEHLFTFKGTVPSGVGASAWDRGLMFGDFAYFAPKPGSMEVLNEWINKRSTPYKGGTKPKFADFGEFELVLCRMDIHPKDILWPTDGGAPWLLDWKRAVYLPRLFQHFIHTDRGSKTGFHARILSKLEPLTERETELKNIFRTAWGNSIRCEA